MIPLRITIDASHTAGSGKNTGIERVVRNLCHQFEAAAAGRELPAPVVATHIHGNFFPIDPEQHRGLKRLSRWEANAMEFLPKWLQAIPLGLARTIGTPKLRKWMQPEPSHLGAYKIPHHIYHASVQTARMLRGNPIQPSSDHLLLLPDAYWTRPEVWQTVQSHREAGTFVVSLVYDLIPLTHPQFVGQKRSQKFRRYLEQLVQHSDMIVAISRTVRDDVVQFIQNEMPSDAPRVCDSVHAFTLGAEIAYSQGRIRPIIHELFHSQSCHTPYLMVASFDPRKNHHQAIDAFDRLWPNHPHLKLCLVGRVGAMCTDVMERIQNHPQLHRGLHVFHDMNDAELRHAYKHCSGVLLPSIVEGFGLPIVESLWHGKKTFASDTPIHREVGGEHCEYFELDSPESLAHAIVHWEEIRQILGASDSGDKRFVPTTWEQSAGQLLDLCFDAMQQHRSARPKAIAA